MGELSEETKLNRWVVVSEWAWNLKDAGIIYVVECFKLGFEFWSSTGKDHMLESYRAA
jgi:hypothetical protein